MLVLTRKEGESIRISDNIVIRIHNIEKNRVRIAIEAPVSVPIYREEIYLKIVEENKQAAQQNVLKNKDDLLKITKKVRGNE